MNESLFEYPGRIFVYIALLFLAVCSCKPVLLFLSFDCWDHDTLKCKERSNTVLAAAPYPLTSEKKIPESTEQKPKISFFKEPSESKKTHPRKIDYPWDKWVSRNKKNIEKSVQDDFNFRDELSECNMLFRKIAGMKMPLSADDTYVVSGKNGHLLEISRTSWNNHSKRKNPQNFEENVQLYRSLAEFSKQNNAAFLVAFLPDKNLFVPNTGRFKILSMKKEEHLAWLDKYVSVLQTHKIPVVNLYSLFYSMGDRASDLFYLHDHHWNMRGAILGGKHIADALNQNFGCKYDLKYFDENIYYKCIYEGIFIGSLGRKVNTPYLKKHKPEDFDLWLPTFDTLFSLEFPATQEKYHGKYSIMYFEDHFKKEKNLYKKCCYMTFFNGDHALIKITNHYTENHKRILFIKNSYANNMIPFLALQTKEIYMLDSRFKNAPDVFEYISKIKPDIVVYCSFPNICSYLSTTY